MKRIFRRFRDDRFALTILQNPNIEVRTHAELVQAAQQERENQQAAAPIPTTQGQPTPVSSHAPASPVLLPPASVCNVSAPLDSTNPDAAPSDPRIEAVRKLAASLGIPVIVETSTLPAVEAEPANQPAPKPRRKSKSRRKSGGTTTPGCAPSATSAETEALHEDDSELTDIERHSRKCSICSHPHREYIEEAVLQWRGPGRSCTAGA